MVQTGHRIAVIAALLSAAGVPERAEAQHEGHELGTVDFSVSCSAPASAEFNRAVALLHHMTYPQAREAFERVATMDPRCAMVHWGVAMTLFQPLWPTRPTPAGLQRGWDEVQRARQLAPATKAESLFVNAAEAFFREPASTDYWTRINRWERAMDSAYRALPEHVEVAAFYALAHLATARSDTISRANADRSASILLRALAAHPDHPGLMHYMVHANDVPTREQESLEITRKYDATAPRNPHALHMPTHIYTRLGDWDAVVSGNIRAAEAALEHPAGERGDLVWDEFPHALEYLVYAYLQMGADDSAAAAMNRLHGTPRLEPSFKTAFHLASTQARYALERSDWKAAAAIVPRENASVPWERYAWPDGISHFARGLGAARSGAPDVARQARARLGELEETARAGSEVLFTRNLTMLRLELDGWLAQAEGKPAEAVRLLREAVALEGSTPKHAVTAGPTLPANELLGDLLFEQGRPRDALEAYERSLAAYPKRYRSVLGAARASGAAGDTARAATYYRELLALAGRGTRRADLDEARSRAGRPD
jgi:tetratricopeptide (TPR) repeat protein